MSTPVLAPSSTWFRPSNTSVTRSNITEINIVNSYTPTGSETASWDASAANDGSVMCYVNGTKLTIAGNGSGKVFANADSSFAFSDSAKKDYYSALTTITGGDLLNTGNATTMERMFQRCASLKALDVSGWDTSSCTDMNAMFNNCTSLATLDVSNWETGNVTTMAGMFNNCNVLTSLDVSGWKVNNVTAMNGMFQNCTSLKALDVSGWDTSSCTTMYVMFNNCTSLATLDVSNWETGNVTTMGFMFNNCNVLTSLDVSGWDTSSCTAMEAMFQNCTSLKALDVSGWDTSSCTTMYAMFNNCTSLATLDVSNWETGNVTTMAGMFNNCNVLTSLDVSGWDTSSCIDMGFMFYGCTSLATLDVSGWDVSKVKNFQGMFECGNDHGATPMIIAELDVSNWDTSSAEDMSFMFYGCQGPKSIDVSGWDVSKVKTFDHMFAHSYLTIGDVGNWTTPAATNMNAMFYSVQNTTLDVSNLITSKVTCFEQMFEQCNKATEIIGLENFDTFNGLGFSEMFCGCRQLKELDLSSFDTTKAKDGADASINGSKTTTMQDMFTAMVSLEKVTLGANFSFNGDGTTTVPENVGVLPTPDGAYIPGADGYWYTQHREKYLPADIQSQTAMTYYASLTIVNNIDFLVKNGSLLNIADEIRVLSGTTNAMGLDAMESHVGEANEDVATEADLISQIASALEGKASGGGSVEMVTVTLKYPTIPAPGATYELHYLNENMEWEVLSGACKMSDTTIEVQIPKNSVIYDFGDYYLSGDKENVMALGSERFTSVSKFALITGSVTIKMSE